MHNVPELPDTPANSIKPTTAPQTITLLDIDIGITKMTAKATILLINGPNLNRLGLRDQNLYGTQTLAEVEDQLHIQTEAPGLSLVAFQSNHEGAIVDFVQAQGPKAEGIIVNAGALTQVGFSLLDALLDAQTPFIEVHISNIYAREKFRTGSILARYAVGQISGMGTLGYSLALSYFIDKLKKN